MSLHDLLVFVSIGILPVFPFQLCGSFFFSSCNFIRTWTECKNELLFLNSILNYIFLIIISTFSVFVQLKRPWKRSKYQSRWFLVKPQQMQFVTSFLWAKPSELLRATLWLGMCLMFMCRTVSHDYKGGNSIWDIVCWGEISVSMHSWHCAAGILIQLLGSKCCISIR